VILEAFMTNPQYASLAAVKNHRVYAVNADTISRAGPRIVDATEQVASIVQAVREESATVQAGTTPTVRSPGLCAAGAILVLSLMICLRWGRNP
jgi:iron complex transport system substrate-binding protein